MVYILLLSVSVGSCMMNDIELVGLSVVGLVMMLLLLIFCLVMVMVIVVFGGLLK